MCPLSVTVADLPGVECLGLRRDRQRKWEKVEKWSLTICAGGLNMGYATWPSLPLLSWCSALACCWVGSASSLTMRRVCTMAMYSCVLLALSTAPSLGSAVASFRALHKVHNNEGRWLSRDAQGDSWWWGRKGGLDRGLGLLRCKSSSSSGNSNGGGGCPVTRAASKQAPNGGGMPGDEEREGLMTALGLIRWVMGRQNQMVR